MPAECERSEVSGLPGMRGFFFCFYDIDGNFNGWDGSFVLEPMMGVSIFWPAHSRAIVGGIPVSMISDRTLKNEDSTRSPNMVMKRAEHPARCDGDP